LLPILDRALLRGLFRVFCLGVTVLFCASIASAISLKEYRERLHAAGTALVPLTYNGGESEAEGPAEFSAAVQNARQSVPPELEVDWPGGRTKVDNHWLEFALGQIEKMAPTEQRRLILLESIERLTALEAEVEAVERAEAGSAQNSDAEKARLSEILRRKEYAPPAPATKSALRRWWEKFVDWFDDLIGRLFPRMQPLSAGPSAVIGLIARIVVIGLAVGLFAFVLWKFLPRLIRTGGRKKKEKKEARVVLGEKLEADQTSADLWAEAEQLARSGNIRAAIRKGYIALLCELGDRKIVGLAQHKTNRDYLTDVRERRGLYDEMRQLTNSFEIHWYGFEPATEQDWTAFRSRYNQALTRS
jgi:hypothetical protein